MGAIRDLVDELRRRGVTVHEWPGWDGRGNEGVGQISPVGAVIHHTGSNYGDAYKGLVSSTRPELAGGMLCNFSGNEDGSLTVIGSGLAWHAGPGVGPSLGPVLGKIPNIRNLMNRLTVGLEIVYPGTQPMRKDQYKTALVFAKTVADLFGGGDIECVRAHGETNGNAPGGSGKWDPGEGPDRTIDMKAFRKDAANFASQEDPFVALSQQQQDTLITDAALARYAIVDLVKPVTDTLLTIVQDEDAQTDLLMWAITDPEQGLRQQVARLQATLDARTALASGDVSADELAAIVERSLTKTNGPLIEKLSGLADSNRTKAAAVSELAAAVAEASEKLTAAAS